MVRKRLPKLFPNENHLFGFEPDDYSLTEEEKNNKRMNNTNELLNTIKVP